MAAASSQELEVKSLGRSTAAGAVVRALLRSPKLLGFIPSAEGRGGRTWTPPTHPASTVAAP